MIRILTRYSHRFGLSAGVRAGTALTAVPVHRLIGTLGVTPINANDTSTTDVVDSPTTVTPERATSGVTGTTETTPTTSTTSTTASSDTSNNNADSSLQLDLSEYLEQARAEFSQRFRWPRYSRHVINRTPSHCLTVALSKHLPAECVPEHKHLMPNLDIKPGESPVLQHEHPLEALPEGFHLLYFPPQGELMSDGAEKDLCPGAPFVHRLWRGGSVNFNKSVEHGSNLSCVEDVGLPTLHAIRGRTLGQERLLVPITRSFFESLVDAQRFIGNKGDKSPVPVIQETRTLVFSRNPAGNATRSNQVEKPEGRGARELKPSPNRVPDSSFEFTPDRTLLFQFSALTYNAHAIHIDPEYAKNVEGYEDVLVHGPLTLVLMLAALRRQCGVDSREATRAAGHEVSWVTKSIEYTNYVPLYAGRKMKVCIRLLEGGPLEKRWRVWIENSEGRVAVRATAFTGPRSDEQKESAARLAKVQKQLQELTRQEDGSLAEKMELKEKEKRFIEAKIKLMEKEKEWKKKEKEWKKKEKEWKKKEKEWKKKEKEMEKELIEAKKELIEKEEECMEEGKGKELIEAEKKLMEKEEEWMKMEKEKRLIEAEKKLMEKEEEWMEMEKEKRLIEAEKKKMEKEKQLIEAEKKLMEKEKELLAKDRQLMEIEKKIGPAGDAVFRKTFRPSRWLESRPRWKKDGFYHLETQDPVSTVKQKTSPSQNEDLFSTLEQQIMASTATSERKTSQAQWDEEDPQNLVPGAGTNEDPSSTLEQKTSPATNEDPFSALEQQIMASTATSKRKTSQAQWDEEDPGNLVPGAETNESSNLPDTHPTEPDDANNQAFDENSSSTETNTGEGGVEGGTRDEKATMRDWLNLVGKDLLTTPNWWGARKAQERQEWKIKMLAERQQELMLKQEMEEAARKAEEEKEE